VCVMCVIVCFLFFLSCVVAVCCCKGHGGKFRILQARSGRLAQFRLGFDTNRRGFSFDEREKKVAEVPKWTRQALAAPDLLFITFGDIGAFYIGFPSVDNAPKYLDKSENLILMDAGKPTSDKKPCKVHVTKFLKKGQ